MLPISHVVVSTSPMAAEAEAPRLPTIEASIYCIIVVVSWASMAGVARLSTSRACWENVIGAPLRIIARSMSFLLLRFIIAKLIKKSDIHNRLPLFRVLW